MTDSPLHKRTIFTLSSDEDDSCITKPLGERLAQRAAISSDNANISKKSSFSFKTSAIHSISCSDDSDEPDDDGSKVLGPLPYKDIAEHKPPDINDNVEASMMNKRDFLLSISSNSKESSSTYGSQRSSSQSSTNDVSQKDIHISSRLIGRQQKKAVTRLRNPGKKTTNEGQELEREKKRQKKIEEQAEKELQREIKRNSRPQDCLKLMVLNVDEQLRSVTDSEDCFNVIRDNDLEFSVEPNVIPYSAIWHRKVSDFKLIDNKVQKEDHKEQENFLILYIPASDFVDKIHSSVLKRKLKSDQQQTLLDYIVEITEICSEMKITVVTVGLENYLRDKKNNPQDNSLFTSQKNCVRKNVSKKDIDEVMTEVELSCLVTYYALSNMTEFGSLLARFTKAIAQSPFKIEKQEWQKGFSWYAEADSKRPVKIEKDGKGGMNLWQQQIQQFLKIGKEIAEAIAAQYPSPMLLINAYGKCSSQDEGEQLLKDIMVRRDYGPLGTCRKVGPALSYKMFHFFMSDNQKQLLKLK